jgi:glycosyltransferase involved in cell wall biosynthesis
VKAMRRVQNGTLVIIGDGPLREQLEADVHDSECRNILFAGHKSSDEVAQLLRGAAFSVVPSEWYENLPLSVMESYACGRAVIAGSSGGLIEMIVPEKTGLLFPPGNAEALATCLRTLFDSPQLQKRWGAEARREAERRYSKRIHLERIMSAYASLLPG